MALPGRLRLMSPRYRRRAMQIVDLLRRDSNFHYCGVGPYAVADMMSLGVPAEKVSMGAYYVEPGLRKPHWSTDGLTRLLWVGRMIPLKRVDTILRALSVLPMEKFTLTLVGDGAEKSALMRQARDLPVTFLPPQPMERVRDIMRQHDIFIFPSNAYEGWGAVVSEALEEGMAVVGSREAGACAALLPEGNLFSCGDWRNLAELLLHPVAATGIGNGAIERGVDQVLEFIKR